MKNKELIFSGLIFAFVLLYELSAYFTTIGLNSANIVKNFFIIAILLILIRRNWSHQIRFRLHIKTFFVIVFLLLILQALFGVASDIITPVIGFMEFYVATKFSDKRFIKYLYASILIITLVATIPLLYYYSLYGYYARDEIVFDKSMQTFLFGFCYILLLLELFNSNGKYKTLILTIFIYLILVNVFILQSKTSIFVLLVIFILMSIWRRNEVKLTLKRYWKNLIIVAIAIPFLPIEWEVPDAIKQAANMLTGETVFVLGKDMREDTYEIRGIILDKTIDIINENPLLGAGFGNMTSALKSTNTRVTQGESQFMDLGIEGGLTYLLAFVILTLPPLITSFKRVSHLRTGYSEEFVFYQLLSFLILCIGNEMLSSLGWIFLGTLMYIYKTKTTVILFSKQDDKN